LRPGPIQLGRVQGKPSLDTPSGNAGSAASNSLLVSAFIMIIRILKWNPVPKFYLDPEIESGHGFFIQRQINLVFSFNIVPHSHSKNAST
jgi:hypothetical protein